MAEKTQEVEQPKEVLNLYQKLAAITGEIGSIAKGGKNREQGYEFIEYAAVAGELRALFAKYKVVCFPTMGERTETEITTKSGAKGYHVLINFTFKFVNGDKPEETESGNWVGEATDYGDKATNKAATAALKYYLMRTFNISEKGDDPDEHSPEAGNSGTTRKTVTNGDAKITPKQKELIYRKLTEAGVAQEDMKGYLIEQFGVTDPENMSLQDASLVIDALIGTQK